MSIDDKLIFLSTVVCVLVIHCPPQNNGEFSLNLLNFRDAIRGNSSDGGVLSYATDSYYSLINNIVENVALSAIKKQRAKLKAEEPFMINFTKDFNLSEAQFSGRGTVENVTLPDASQFLVTNLTSYKQENEVNFEIFYPKFSANDINYNVQGKALTRVPVKGRGKVNATITNVTIQGEIRYSLGNGIYQLENISLHYNFDSFDLIITGLKVPFMSPASLNGIISTVVTNYLRNNEKEISAEASKTITKQLNKQLRKYSFFDFIKSLWASLSPSKAAKKPTNSTESNVD